jgi:hypothetical protein
MSKRTKIPGHEEKTGWLMADSYCRKLDVYHFLLFDSDYRDVSYHLQ